MITGIITIKFKESISDEEIQELTNEFYNKNSKLITSMEFKQLKDEQCLSDCSKAINCALEVNQE